MFSSDAGVLSREESLEQHKHKSHHEIIFAKDTHYTEFVNFDWHAEFFMSSYLRDTFCESQLRPIMSADEYAEFQRRLASALSGPHTSSAPDSSTPKKPQPHDWIPNGVLDTSEVHSPEVHKRRDELNASNLKSWLDKLN